MTNMVYVGQGPIYVGDYNQTTYKVENQVSVGCGNRVLSISLNRETAEVKESCSGSRLTLMEYTKSKSVTARLEMQEFDEFMLALAFHGAAATIAAGNVTNEVLPTMVAGGFYHTKHPKISTVVLQDAAGSPATLAAGTDYEVSHADYGRIKILNLGSFTQPFNIDYAYASRINIKPFSIASVIKAITFDGISTADNKRVRVLLPRVSFSPTQDFNFLGDDAAVLTVEGQLLLAEIPNADPVLGQFGNIELL